MTPPPHAQPGEASGAPGHGPLADEAAKLAEAIAEWARGATSGLNLPIGDAAECRLCPFCQLLAVLRRTQPETFGHLADASSSLIAALRTVVERHEAAGHRNGGVQRIDLDPGEGLDHETPAGGAERSHSAS
ncbi:MAG TPA: DUF5304 family protein [Mycobacteriales bacterium]|nr:DUF5304 family protein [Mycobacteriales bacterium]